MSKDGHFRHIFKAILYLGVPRAEFVANAYTLCVAGCSDLPPEGAILRSTFASFITVTSEPALESSNAQPYLPAFVTPEPATDSSVAAPPFSPILHFAAALKSNIIMTTGTTGTAFPSGPY